MNRTPRWAVGSLLLLLVWHTAPVLAQEQAPFQLRVTGGCAVGSSIRQINLDGTVVCQSAVTSRSEEHTSELQSRPHLVCRLLLEKKKEKNRMRPATRW